MCSIVDTDNLRGYLKRRWDDLVNNPDNATEGLLILTEIVYDLTGKRSYLLIDEYDKLLMDNYGTAPYAEIRSFMTAFFSAGLKGNHFLEKALLTGVMRISHESIFSGLNNIVTYDVFEDEVYTNDYGLTDDEVETLCRLTDINVDKLRQWYNGVRVSGQAIYNMYSVMSHLAHKKFGCYWGKSGTMDTIAKSLNDKRRATLTTLMNGEQVEVPIVHRVSMQHPSAEISDQVYYSLLVQAGYLTIHRIALGSAVVSIPNTELLIVWKDFILQNLYLDAPKIKTLFDNADNLKSFSRDLEYFLQDRLSYHDLAIDKSHDSERTRERIYHVFMLGLLSAYDDIRCVRPVSNRESGDGRYDILVQRPDTNFIFEFKSSENPDKLEEQAKKALSQIEAKRYGADLDPQKPLIRVGIAFSGKKCRAVCDN